MNKHTIAGIAALATSLAAAHGVIVNDVPRTGNFSGTMGGPNIVIQNVTKFNGSLGALKSITLEISGITANSSVVFDNEGTGGMAAFNLISQVQGHTGEAIISDFFADFSLSRNGPVGLDSEAGPANFVGSDILAITSGGSSASGSILQTAPQYLTQFTASPGQTSFPLTVSSRFITPLTLSSAAAGVAGAFNAPSQTFTGSYRITYSYENALAAVPEAGTLLFGAAMGISLALRRMRSQVA